MACELTHWNSPECLDALSAACAEAGDFTSAVKWQSRAVQLLPAGDKTRVALSPPPLHVRGPTSLPGLIAPQAQGSPHRSTVQGPDAQAC